MSSSFTPKELEIVQQVLDRFYTYRLPALLKMKEQVDSGGVLNDVDVSVLEASIKEAKGGEEFAQKHPELANLVSEVAELYNDITTKALDNQKNR